MAAATLLVVAKWLLPIFLRENITTMPEFLERRYDNRVRASLAIFWLLLYIFVNLTSSWATLGAERKGVAAAGWIKPLLLFVSVPLAMTIPVVAGLAYTAFPANLWFVSLLAPRLLLSSFAGSTALLLLTILVLKRTTAFDAGKDLVSKLSTFVVYAASLHFLLQSMSQAMPLIWLSLVCGIASITILLMPQLKSSTSWLAVAAAGILFAIWLEKGAVLLYSPTGGIDAGYYTPAFAEISMTLGLCSLGMLLLTILLKVAVAIKMTK
jgi:molybdopterin-containing oxidoreductase family membrane subunit